MRADLRFIALPAVLLLLFFLGKLILSFQGAPYQLGVQLFSMVTLQVHLALLWGAVGRRYEGHGILRSLRTGLLIGLVAQLLIVLGTAISYVVGDTHFNAPIALNQDAPVEFGAAMLIRLGGLVANSIFSAIIAAIGWALGGLLPRRDTR